VRKLEKKKNTNIKKLKYTDVIFKMFWNGNLNYNHAVLIQCFLILAAVYRGNGIPSYLQCSVIGPWYEIFIYIGLGEAAYLVGAHLINVSSRTKWNFYIVYAHCRLSV